MRLAIVNLTGGGLSGGYRKYLKNMLPRLTRHKDVEALLCLIPEGSSDISSWLTDVPDADYSFCSPITVKHLVHIPDRNMAACIDRFAPDVIFMPVDRYIGFNGIPVVNMVRNMEPLIPNMKDDNLKERFRKFVQRKLTCNSVRQADHTIAVSKFVKEYLVGAIHIPQEKVSHVYHGIALPRKATSRPASLPPAWNGGFLFTCGSIRPARGLEDAFAALDELKFNNFAMRLVIAGDTGAGMIRYHDQLDRLLKGSGLTDKVCWAGNLNDDEMRWCYENCGLFIMTSRIEACPNIALEAMSHGCLCISTDSPPMPEFFEQSAIYYRHGDGKSLCSAIQHALSLSEGQQKDMSSKARIRASQFSWDVCARETVNTLTQVMTSAGKGRE